MEIRGTNRHFEEKLPEWPGIDNVIARRVVTTAYRLIPTGTTDGPVFDKNFHPSPKLIEHQKWLNAALRKSGIAEGLAGGEAFLPDFYMHLPNWLKLFVKPLKSRNIEQLTRHVLYNLEWYCDASRQVNNPVSTIRSMLIPAGLMTVVVLIVMLLSTTLSKVQVSSAIAVVFLSFVGILGLGNFFRDNSAKHRTNCVEFYKYLVESYNDPDKQTSSESTQHKRDLPFIDGPRNERKFF